MNNTPHQSPLTKAHLHWTACLCVRTGGIVKWMVTCYYWLQLQITFHHSDNSSSYFIVCWIPALLPLKVIHCFSRHLSESGASARWWWGVWACWVCGTLPQRNPTLHRQHSQWHCSPVGAETLQPQIWPNKTCHRYPPDQELVSKLWSC